MRADNRGQNDQKTLALVEGGAASRLKVVQKQLNSSDETEINKKVNDALVWTGFYKKTFKERLDHVQ